MHTVNSNILYSHDYLQVLAGAWGYSSNILFTFVYLSIYKEQLITMVMLMPAVAHKHLWGLNNLLCTVSSNCHVVTCTKESAKRVPSPLPQNLV